MLTYTNYMPTRRSKDPRLVSSFSYPTSKKEIIEKADQIAQREGKYLSDLIIEALEERVKYHDQAGNPQTFMDQYEDPTYKAVPALSLNYESWKKFYKDLTKKDFVDMDKKFQMVLYYHEKRRKELDKK